MITDEIRHKAWDVFTDCKSEFISDKLRAVLEAVAPMLIVQGMYMATDMLTGDPHSFRDRILGRAAAIALGQELDPK